MRELDRIRNRIDTGALAMQSSILKYKEYAIHNFGRRWAEGGESLASECLMVDSSIGAGCERTRKNTITVV